MIRWTLPDILKGRGWTAYRLAHEAGRVTGEEARALGVHVNFAPVVDVNNNPRNPVINTRSYGEDPQMVGRLASAYIRGMQAAGVSATLKHFPGHGSTSKDSHVDLPTVAKDRAALSETELAPFRTAIAKTAGLAFPTSCPCGSLRDQYPLPHD